MTVGEDFPNQQARCRELLDQYAEVAKLPGVNVSFAVEAIKLVLARSDRAMASGDVVEILRSYQEMRGCA